ncbi:major facilitator superfamily domain-containing protein [Cytidiella melzeri]|nr:major facilitator superfamily domain-containing protein [Cytidiella melzeri]
MASSPPVPPVRQYQEVKTGPSHRQPPSQHSSPNVFNHQRGKPTIASSKCSTVTAVTDIPFERLERVSVRLASAFTIFFVLGWGDGVTGTLLPYFKDAFHLSFMLSSLCFVASTVGFALGTTLVERILGLVGWICISPDSRRSIFHAMLQRRVAGNVYGHSPTQARFIATWAGTLVHPVFFVIMGCRKNFASMLVAYAISAFSRSVLTGKNHYVASTPRKALGYMYGFWSIGSMCAPLVCQSVIATGIAWNHFYFGSLVLSAISSCLACYAFRPSLAELEGDLLHSRVDNSPSQAITQEKYPKLPQTPDSEETIGLPELQKDAPAPSPNLLRALKVPLLWALVIFLGIYTGVEADTQGFIVTYLLVVRNANPKTVGYATSGFWGGQAISRFLWGYLNTRWAPLQMISRRRLTYMSLPTGLALALQLTLWFVNSFVENCFAAALLGLVYGPIFVAGLALINDLLPVDLHMISMQIGASSASFGAALFPFLAGTIMSYKGPKILTYVLVSDTSALMILWFLLPSKPRN